MQNANFTQHYKQRNRVTAN